MIRLRIHARLLMLAACLALAAQGVVAFESVWHHHHDEAPAESHEHGCAICAAIAHTGQPVEPPAQAPTPQFVYIAPILGHALPAFLAAITPISSRGPPSTAAI